MCWGSGVYLPTGTWSQGEGGRMMSLPRETVYSERVRKVKPLSQQNSWKLAPNFLACQWGHKSKCMRPLPVLSFLPPPSSLGIHFHPPSLWFLSSYHTNPGSLPWNQLLEDKGLPLEISLWTCWAHLTCARAVFSLWGHPSGSWPSCWKGLWGWAQCPYTAGHWGCLSWIFAIYNIRQETHKLANITFLSCHHCRICVKEIPRRMGANYILDTPR